jgi:RNA polymerase sigma-70 factor (ECF subfamily)
MARGPRFLELVERHEREIFRFAYRMTGKPEDAADVLQETFLRAFRAFHRLPDGANARAWLFRIAGRLALNHRRAERARRSEPIERAAGLSDPRDDVESAVEERRLAARLERAVLALGPRQRAALLLRKHEGLSYREVAGALGCTEETARANVYQAMRRVRRALATERG